MEGDELEPGLELEEPDEGTLEDEEEEPSGLPLMAEKRRFITGRATRN